MERDKTGRNNTSAQEVGEIISKSEEFLHRNRKMLLAVLITVVAVVAIAVAYQRLYKIPREKQAYESLFRAEYYFGVDSFELALNGDGMQVMGFLDVIDKYGGTKAGNLAQAYAGITLYNLGREEEAVKHLSKYKAKDDMISPAVQGLVGDCYVNMGDVAKGITYFKKAAAAAKNDVIAPVYLKKAGIAYESLGENDKALECYKEIKERHLNSTEAATIDKYIERVTLKK